MLVIVDYGVGNIGALLNMYDHLGIECVASADQAIVAGASHLLLPGVGAFDKAMTMLRTRELVGPLVEARSRGASILGICLGMQLLARRSAEGNEAGLAWIAADVVRIAPPAELKLKIPHIGWSEVCPTAVSPIFPDIRTPERFYFTHSFHMRCDDPADVAATIDYGGELTCAVSNGNIHGAQFHPEKSHRFGMRLLQSFANA